MKRKVIYLYSTRIIASNLLITHSRNRLIPPLSRYSRNLSASPKIRSKIDFESVRPAKTELRAVIHRYAYKLKAHIYI